MSDLLTQLREYGQQLDSAAAPLQTGAPADDLEGRRPMARRPIAVVAVAAVATIVLIGATAWLLRGQPTAPAEPEIPETWSTWTPADGLVSDCACQTAMAENGTVWIVGFDGISRFDGAAWERIEPPRPFEGEGWPAVAHAPDRSVWISGMSYVARYSEGEWGPIVETAAYTDEEGPAWFEGLWIDADGRVWTAFRDETGVIEDGAFVPRPEPEEPSTEAFEPPEGATALATAPDGTIWMVIGDTIIGVDGALIAYDGEDFIRHDLGGVEAAAFGSDGIGWFLVPQVSEDAFIYGRKQWSEPGLYRLDENGWFRVSMNHGLPGYRFTDMLQGPGGELWLVTADGTATRYQPGTNPQAGTAVEIARRPMTDADWSLPAYPPPTEAP